MSADRAAVQLGPNTPKGFWSALAGWSYHNSELRRQAVENAMAKERFGVDVPVMPFGNTIQVGQRASGSAWGMAALAVLGMALGGAGTAALLARGEGQPAAVQAPADEGAAWQVDVTLIDEEGKVIEKWTE